MCQDRCGMVSTEQDGWYSCQWVVRALPTSIQFDERRPLGKYHYGLAASSSLSSFPRGPTDISASDSVADCMGVFCRGCGASSSVKIHPCSKATWRSSRVSSPCASSRQRSRPANLDEWFWYLRGLGLWCRSRVKADNSDRFPAGKQQFLSARPSCNSN